MAYYCCCFSPLKQHRDESQIQDPITQVTILVKDITVKIINFPNMSHSQQGPL